MANEKEGAGTLDKGKGKATEPPKKDDAVVKDAKDAKGEPKEEELSEEDQQLKSELDMLAERLKESDTTLFKPALEAIKTFIRTSTSSMTAVPKPLKFLRPHYDDLTALYDKWQNKEDKLILADVLSVLGMTYSDDDRQESLKYRLLSPTDDIGGWGHEYVRHLALEIGTVFNKRQEKEEDTQDISDLALSLIPYFLSHNAEADAVDLLSELEMIDQLPQYLDEDTYARACLYMVSMVNLLPFPDDIAFLRTAHDIYRQYDKLTQAVVLAIRLNDNDLISDDFNATEDPLVKKQIAFIIARQQIWMDDEDDEVAECLKNTKLSAMFQYMAKELNLAEPKAPDDIYKTHLEHQRGGASSNVDSARHNLASTFVNAFVNAGFGQDKLMLVEDETSPWVYKNKDLGKLSAAASTGLLMLWDVDMGLAAIDKYTYSEEMPIRAGAHLGVGLVNSGIQSDSDPALALLGDQSVLDHENPTIRMSAIMGLGLSYAGSHRTDLIDFLTPLLNDSNIQLCALAALSLGLIFVGSSNGDVSSSILETLFAREPSELKDKWARFLSLGLALLFVSRQEEADTTIETLKVIDHPFSKHTQVLVNACAYAGTGNVLKIQSMLHLCNEHIDKAEKDKDKDSKESKEGDDIFQPYAVLAIALIAMGEEVGQEMVLRQFGHLMHYGEGVIRKSVPLAMGLVSASNPQMRVYDTLSRYSHDNDNDVALNAIFAMGLVGAGTNNARLAQLLRSLVSYYHRDENALFMVRIAQGLLHMGKGTISVNPFHTDRQVMSRVSVAGLLTVLVSLVDAKSFVLSDAHYLLFFLVPAMHPRFLVTLDEDLKPLAVNVRVGQAVDVVGQAGRPKTITGWQTQSTPVLLAYGERAELEDEQYIALTNSMEGLVILKKNPEWEAEQDS
ncbi:26S proteasome regulatory subunit rpn-1 [Drechslerella stenobrocha 248]|uniref:26S proteasome regulatory subunit RPN1 n=1 Tax=Drechslerella stenobrocha 248 TaxID=1043628 RepID=W7HWU1_9PEZI|nr:26S proteasome regulatory subunit rpn-1 [Drechslerella stenobrocha 248]